jgi:N,N'-diacetyllegionaminate synthase
MKKIRLDNRKLGSGEPCFIVAEAGVNHNGDIDLAKNLIDEAKKANADAVKFQAFKAERIASIYARKTAYQIRTTKRNESQLAMLKRLELSDEEFKELYDHSKKKNIIFLSSAFDKESVDLLDNLGVPAFKIASGEITNFPLLAYIAKRGKPVILSTGMSTLKEIREALSVIRKNGTKDVILLHCLTSYPAKDQETNLRVIETLRQKFRVPVGFSDHTLGITVSIAAVALGAVLIERHFTSSRDLPGPDQKASLEPNELKEMISTIRTVEKALGNGVKKLTEEEKQIRKDVRKSVVARVKIPQGTVITEDMLDTKRPGLGIEPKYLNRIIGKRAKRDMMPDEFITFRKIV